MKKVFLASVFVFSMVFVNAQDVNFGATAGYINSKGKIEGGNLAVNGDGLSGFYVGALAEFSLLDKIAIQPELLYASYDEGSSLLLPVLLKFSIVEQFYLQGGPQLSLDLEDSDLEDYSKTTLHFPIGAGYDITDNIFIEARYALPLSNAYNGNADIKINQQFVTIGLGYKF